MLDTQLGLHWKPSRVSSLKSQGSKYWTIPRYRNLFFAPYGSITMNTGGDWKTANWWLKISPREKESLFGVCSILSFGEVRIETRWKFKTVQSVNVFKKRRRKYRHFADASSRLEVLQGDSPIRNCRLENFSVVNDWIWFKKNLVTRLNRSAFLGSPKFPCTACQLRCYFQ